MPFKIYYIILSKQWTSLAHRAENPLLNRPVFVLENNTNEKFSIIHLDVYQGKNAANNGIPEEIQTLPTTQKAVVNAIMQSKITNDPNGKCCVLWTTDILLQPCSYCYMSSVTSSVWELQGKTALAGQSNR